MGFGWRGTKIVVPGDNVVLVAVINLELETGRSVQTVTTDKRKNFAYKERKRP